VDASEAGMKLLRFLERRLEPGCPAARLHKWIRTGQVRVNGGRAHFKRVLAADDAVRLPPFALARQLVSQPAHQPVSPFASPPLSGPPVLAGGGPENASARELVPALFLGPDLPLAAVLPDCLVLNKAGGLACQPGTGQGDSVAERLRRAFAGAAYIPAPAHRLDRRTSGLLLAALNHAAQQRLHHLFRTGRIRKEYLAWVFGVWPHNGVCLLRDRLRRITDASGKERTAALPGGSLETLPFPDSCPPLPCPDSDRPLSCPDPSLLCACSDGPLPSACPDRPFPSSPFSPRAGGYGAEARRDERAATCALAPVQSLAREELPLSPAAPAGGRAEEGATLLLIRPFTGRRHQIRVQLASRGFPLIGDRGYGGPPFSALLLHAYALGLPSESLVPAASAAPPQSPTPPASSAPPESPVPPEPPEQGARGESIAA
jgi:23S rRNA pseudouridine955/2504/2580 synthase